MCTFCEYLDEQRDSAKQMLPRERAARDFSVDGVVFTVAFDVEPAHIVVTIDGAHPGFQLLADALTVLWKLRPAELLESLCDHRVVGGAFYTITYDDPDHGENGPSDVTIIDGETELNVPSAFFSAVVVELARIHLQAVGKIRFPWFDALSAAAKAKIE
ncbi:hypothetical protein [Pseudorhodoplanes sinuspersici]|nr:hypothetical protein [Pseudorhodoplanes sinuspersici]